MCTVPTLRLLPQYEEVKVVGVGIKYTAIFGTPMITITTTVQGGKGVGVGVGVSWITTTAAVRGGEGSGVGVSQRDKHRDFRHYDRIYGITATG